ncbi:MAG: hypothetical protein RLZZ150_642 [Bacteroidota bacterium]|jgi:2-keto-4-pentenoate hydratase/2-oxohepta-3-ene-1,7-dioic acid hydratase in catechol pathway
MNAQHRDSSAHPSWSFTDGRSMPVGTLYCIGRNYADHAAEMQASVPTDPIVFLKPPAALIPSGSTLVLPSWTSDVHHEVECIVVLGQDLRDCNEHEAWSAIAGIGVGLDLTARDVQQRAKSAGHPWAVAKSWYGSAPVSTIVPFEQSAQGPWDLRCSVNGELRQNGSTAAMERNIPMLIQYLASVFSLRRGDAIFTGTPAGVGPIRSGDLVVGELGTIARVELHVG